MVRSLGPILKMCAGCKVVLLGHLSDPTTSVPLRFLASGCFNRFQMGVDPLCLLRRSCLASSSKRHTQTQRHQPTLPSFKGNLPGLHVFRARKGAGTDIRCTFDDHVPLHTLFSSQFWGVDHSCTFNPVQHVNKKPTIEPLTLRQQKGSTPVLVGPPNTPCCSPFLMVSALPA